tara:strand:- start:2491 stop:2676 length:186 start_codon:yes stop_codon:yes gene_type:complete
MARAGGMEQEAVEAIHQKRAFPQRPKEGANSFAQVVMAVAQQKQKKQEVQEQVQEENLMSI